MSIQAILYFEDRPINALQAQYSFKQESDYNGKPSAKPRFMGFDVTIESTKDSDIMEWMIDPNLAKQLKLKFVPRVVGTKTRTIDFIDAHCIHYVEHFKSDGVTPMTTTLHITAAGVKDSAFGTEFQEYWRTTFPNTAPVTQRSTNEKKLTKYFLTNTEGDEIEDYEIGQTIVLNIETSNRIGDKVSINLNDKEHDFKYNGSILKNDTIKNFVIGSNLETIELEVIDQQEAA